VRPAAHVETGERTIAVLTFTNVTGDAADDWIGTGIAETVTSDLRNVRDVT
jgi:TolB-like protein